MKSLLDDYKSKHVSETGYGTDQNFLADVIYPMVIDHALVHDDYHKFEPPEKKTPFRVPIDGHHFIGQSYDENENMGWKVTDFQGTCKCQTG